jgi:hypothetical protein
MRRILVDAARRKSSRKHGGQHARQSIADSEIAVAAPPAEVLAVNEALDQLAAWASRAQRVTVLGPTPVHGFELH